MSLEPNKIHRVKSGHSDLPACRINAPFFLSDAYKKRTQARKRQARVPLYGRSMVEMLGVLAIIGVLSVGGIAGYSRAMFKYKMNQTIQIVTQAMQRLVEISDKDWGGDDEIWTTQDYVNYGLLPAQLCPEDYVDIDGHTGSSCKLPLGEIDLWFMKSSHSPKPSGEFYITFFEGDIKESCVTFLSHGWQNLYPQEWLMSADGGSFIRVGAPKESKTLWAEKPEIYGGKKDNITLSDIENACSICEGASWCLIEMIINNEI